MPRILLSEQPHDAPEGATAFSLRDAVKPGADVVVVNTCGFLSASRQESLDHINNLL